MLAERDMDGDDDEDNKDTRNWKSHVPEWLYKCGDVFSKTKSERMPEQKMYDHPIDIEEGACLPKLAKVYPLSPNERNLLDSWIDKEL